MLLCWHSVCANCLHRGWATQRIDWASFTEGNCIGAKWCTFVMRFLTALLKPCLDLLPTAWNYFDRDIHIISLAKHKHVTFKRKWSLTLTSYLPIVLLTVHTKAWNNMMPVRSGSLKMLWMKTLMNITLSGFLFWAMVGPVRSPGRHSRSMHQQNGSANVYPTINRSQDDSPLLCPHFAPFCCNCALSFAPHLWNCL